MEQTQKNVLAFHKKFEVTVNTKPTVCNKEIMRLRQNLIFEEFEELQCALEEGNLVKIADGCADLIYVINGTAVSYGIDLEPIHEEVQRSNMSKVWEDGTVHRRDDGKILKPPTYSPAQIDLCIKKQTEYDETVDPGWA